MIFFIKVYSSCLENALRVIEMSYLLAKVCDLGLLAVSISLQLASPAPLLMCFCFHLLALTQHVVMLCKQPLILLL